MAKSSLSRIATSDLVAEVTRRLNDYRALEKLDPTFRADRPGGVTPLTEMTNRGSEPKLRRRKKGVPESKLLAAIGNGKLPAGEIAKRTGLEPSGLYTRLNLLIKSKKIDKEEVGGRLMYSLAKSSASKTVKK